jgi:hypothetical protein
VVPSSSFFLSLSSFPFSPSSSYSYTEIVVFLAMGYRTFDAFQYNGI